jgi:hypothetical protein
MPEQQVFFKQEARGLSIEVLKTYDYAFAREAFENMDEAAHRALFDVLDINSNYELADIPVSGSQEFLDFLWEEVLESAREDGNILSFFIVTETAEREARHLYVSPDWPSAERFARNRLGIRPAPTPA